MPSGPLREVIRFIRAVTTVDDTGSEVKAWQAIDNDPDVWAQIKTLPGSESFNGDKTEFKVPYEITIRYRDDLDERYRIQWNDIVININAINPSEKKDYLVLSCEFIDG